jgi:hypothetical protein
MAETAHGTLTTATATATAKLHHRAELAQREGNYALAKTLVAKAKVLDPWTASDVVRLPDADSVREAWAILGFPTEDGHPVPVGIHRRLAAALNSIRTRGFAAAQFHFEAPDRRGSRRLLWESECGFWSNRHWRVTALVTPTHTGVSVRDVTVAVKSSAAALDGRVEWTAFTGRALNSAMAERLTEVLSVLRVRWTSDGDTDLSGAVLVDLTEDERGAYDDLHPYPAAAMLYRGDRIVLWDGGCGSGSLEGASPGTLADLARAGLLGKRVEEIDGAVPNSERPIR